VRARRLAFAALLLAATSCQAEPRRDGAGGSGLGEVEGGREERRDEAKAARPAPAQPSPAPTGAGDASSPAAPGSPQRAAILDAMRPAIETALRSPVEFVVTRIGVEGGWALVIADPQRPGGGAIDGSHLGPEEERDGLTVNAILRFRNGRWNLVDHAIGPTDVWYCGFEGPPRSLLGC
jgi:hypothetical protein